jgi:hypothetical protein
MPNILLANLALWTDLGGLPDNTVRVISKLTTNYRQTAKDMGS